MADLFIPSDHLDANLIAIIPGPIPLVCPSCGEQKGNIAIRHRNTAYVDDSLNYMTSCLECYQEDYDYYQERWDDYYADVYQGLWNY